MLVSEGCQDKIPQDVWFQTTEICPFTFLVDSKSETKELVGLCFSEVGRVLSYSLLGKGALPGGGCRFFMLFGQWLYHSNLYFHSMKYLWSVSVSFLCLFSMSGPGCQGLHV